MATKTLAGALVPVAVDKASDRSLQDQLYDELRRLILSGQLAPATRLPSTRVLARDLSISRNTVLGAFEQVLAEGYLASRTGAGT